MPTFLLMAVGVVAVSMSAPLIAAMTVPTLTIAFWRNGLATGSLAGSAWSRRSELVELDARARWVVVLAGVALAVHFATWVPSLRLTSVSSATALGALELVWVVIWEIRQGRRYSRAVAVGAVLSLAGVVMVSGVDLTISLRALEGDALALVGGVAVAVYMVLGAKARERLSTSTYTFACYGTAATLLLALCLASGQELVRFSVGQWLLLLLLTVSAQLLGHSVFNHLLATTSPTLVALGLLLEVPGASLLAGLFLGQVPSAAALLGLVAILAGMVLVIRGGGAARGAGVQDLAR